MQMLEYSGGRPCSKLWDKRGLIDQLSLIGQICVAANVQGTISKRTKFFNSLQVKWEMQSMAINIRPNLQPNSDVQTNAITHKFHYQPLNYIESDFYSNIFFIRMYSKQFISGSVFWCWCQLKPPPPSAVWPFGTDAISKQDKTAKRMQQIIFFEQTNKQRLATNHF